MAVKYITRTVNYITPTNVYIFVQIKNVLCLLLVVLNASFGSLDLNEKWIVDLFNSSPVATHSLVLTNGS